MLNFWQGIPADIVFYQGHPRWVYFLPGWKPAGHLDGISYAWSTRIRLFVTAKACSSRRTRTLVLSKKIRWEFVEIFHCARGLLVANSLCLSLSENLILLSYLLHLGMIYDKNKDSSEDRLSLILVLTGHDRLEFLDKTSKWENSHSLVLSELPLYCLNFSFSIKSLHFHQNMQWHACNIESYVILYQY